MISIQFGKKYPKFLNLCPPFGIPWLRLCWRFQSGSINYFVNKSEESWLLTFKIMLSKHFHTVWKVQKIYKSSMPFSLTIFSFQQHSPKDRLITFKSFCLITFKSFCLITFKSFCLITFISFRLITFKSFCLITFKCFCLITFKSFCLIPLNLLAWSPLNLFAWSPLNLFAWSPLNLFAWSPLNLFAWSPLNLFNKFYLCDCPYFSLQIKHF